MTKDEIIKEIEAHLVNNGVKLYSECYVGIAENVRDRLFSDHKVIEKGDVWIYEPADSDDVARDTENYFLDKGMKGGTGGGSEKSTYVYSYKINEHTSESPTIDKEEGKG